MISKDDVILLLTEMGDNNKEDIMRVLKSSSIPLDILKKINDFGTTILVTTHNENIVNNLQKRVVTMKDGKIVDDQKNGGIYKLDETPRPKMPKKVIQTPGHALRPKQRMIQ